MLSIRIVKLTQDNQKPIDKLPTLVTTSIVATKSGAFYLINTNIIVYQALV